MNYVYREIPSPVGRLRLIASERGLAAILWENDRGDRVPLRAVRAPAAHPILLEAERQLNEYFAGERVRFDLEFDMVGTDFQKKVWRELLKIPFGETRSYGELARRIGSPRGSRAVGAANGKNPLSIVVPCHRVIGASGQLVGFAGGLKTKALLLKLERKWPTPC